MVCAALALCCEDTFGVGEAIDIILAVVGIVSIGIAVFTGMHELWDLANGVYRAATTIWKRRRSISRGR